MLFVYKVEEAAEQLGISADHVRLLLQRNILTGLRLSEYQWRIAKQAIEALLPKLGDYAELLSARVPVESPPSKVKKSKPVLEDFSEEDLIEKQNFSVQEASQLLGIKRNKILMLLAHGYLEGSNLGMGEWTITRRSLDYIRPVILNYELTRYKKPSIQAISNL